MNSGLSPGKIIFDKNNPDIIYILGSYEIENKNVIGISQSHDGGETWTRTQITSLQNCSISTFSVFPGNSNILFAGGQISTNSENKGILFRSADGGMNWENVSTALQDAGNYVRDLCFAPGSPTTIYAACDNDVYQSSDGGLTWQSLNTSLSHLIKIVIDSQAPDRIYAITRDRGLFIKDGDNESWIDIDPEYSTGIIQTTEWDLVNHLLYLGTNYQGIFYINLSITNITDEKPPQLSGLYCLRPNYPNPFNSSTTISFNLAKAEKVKITLYNILGRKVDIVTDKEYGAGSHEIPYKTKELPSGIYFYIMEAGAFVDMNKLIILK